MAMVCSARLGWVVRSATARSSVMQTRASSTYGIKTFNAISPVGLKRFPSEKYTVSPDEEEPFAILLRSHALQDEEVLASVRAVARCGAGTNNVPVARMTERGIPVFNSPGANANAVKELVLCSLLLSSRGIAQSIGEIEKMLAVETDPAVIKKRVEAEKKRFGGCEIKGKTLGVIGLGAIGASVAEAAMDLGMNIMAYDPAISIEAAWRLPGGNIDRVLRLEELLTQCDYITLHGEPCPCVCSLPSAFTCPARTAEAPLLFAFSALHPRQDPPHARPSGVVLPEAVLQHHQLCARRAHRPRCTPSDVR